MLQENDDVVMILGLDIDFVAPSARPLEHLDEYYDFAAMVPMQAENSLKDFKSKKIIIGGAKINDVLVKKLLNIPKPFVTKPWYDRNHNSYCCQKSRRKGFYSFTRCNSFYMKEIAW
jgi:hypothetical protein